MAPHRTETPIFDDRRPDESHRNEPQICVRISALEAGKLTLPEHFFCADQHDKNVRNTVPSMSFLINHPPSGKRVVFDLGMRRDLAQYPPEIQPHLKSRQPIFTTPDVSDSLRAGGLDPKDIDAIVLSHVHYDHVGTPGDFTRALFIVGPGTRQLLLHGMKYHSAAHFEKDLLPVERSIELPEPGHAGGQGVGGERFDAIRLESFVGTAAVWQPLAPFENGIDLFGDGSVYIVNSPGHLQGHLNLLARVGQRRWVYLAGDACHHPRILDGETEMATWQERGQLVCIHQEKAGAEGTLRKMMNARKEGFRQEKIEIILAHDANWAKEHRDRFFPGFL